MARRRCKGETEDGDCRANPLKDSDYCLAHSDATTRESVGFIAANGKAGRPKNPRAVDVLRERLEERVDAVLDVLWDGLEADLVTVSGSGEDAERNIEPDHRIRITAAREILDRAYGRPRQTTEVSGPDGGPLTVVDLSDEQTRALVGDLLRRRPATSDK
jgi:hypothetical protein